LNNPDTVEKPAERQELFASKSSGKSIARRIQVLLSMISDPAKAHDVWYIVNQYMPNPDPVLTLAGKDSIEFYDSMVDSDAHLAGLMGVRTDAVAGLEWDVIPASDDSADEQMAEWVRKRLLNIDEFGDDLEELLGALRNGYSVSEIMWKMEGNQAVPDSILSRRPSRFSFDYHNRLMLKTWDAYNGEAVPPNKFIVHRNKKRYEGPYGVSVLRSVYWPWHFKHYGFQWWIIAAERNAVPTPKAAFPIDWDLGQQAALYNALLGFQNDNAIIYPAGAELDFFQTKTDPQLNEKLRDACNEEMAWGILGSSHSTGTGSKGGGSFALAKEHGTVRQDVLERDSNRLQATLNTQLIEPMVILNYGEQPGGFPRFKLRFEPPADRELEMKIISGAVKIGIPVDQQAAAEKIGVVLATDTGGEAIVMPVQSFGGFGEQPPEESELKQRYEWPLKMR